MPCSVACGSPTATATAMPPAHPGTWKEEGDNAPCRTLAWPPDHKLGDAPGLSSSKRSQKGHQRAVGSRESRGHWECPAGGCPSTGGCRAQSWHWPSLGTGPALSLRCSQQSDVTSNDVSSGMATLCSAGTGQWQCPSPGDTSSAVGAN